MGLGTVLWHWLSSKFWFDWLCLFLIINPYFLCYYGYDSIGSIMDATEKLFHTDKAGIGLLYSMHSIPVIVTVFFIGIVIDKFGTQKTALFLAVVTLLGSICVATGHNYYGILVLGRLLFGFGSECMSVTAQKMLAQRFKDSMLSLAFGFQILWGQAGSCIVFILMPVLNEKFGTIGALWSVPIYGAFSLLTTLAYFWIDVEQTAATKIRNSPPVSPNTSLHDDFSSHDHAQHSVVYSTAASSLLSHQPPRPRDTKHSPHSDLHPHPPADHHHDVDHHDLDPHSEVRGMITGQLKQNQRSSAAAIFSSAPVNPPSATPLPPLAEDPHVELNDAHLHHHEHSEQFQFKDLKTFPFAFWVLLILYFSASTTFFVWNTFGGDRLNEKYGISPKDAGIIVAYSNMAAMASPISGFFVDRIGHRTKFIFSGVSLMLITYCAITWTKVVPTLWYVLLGIGVSLCQPIVFASVSLVVKPTVNGTAFALMSLALNIGQVALPAIVGAMHSKSGSYQSSNYVFVALALVCLLFAAILFIIERKMQLLDKIGLWRDSAPPSVYSSLYSHTHDLDPHVIPTSPLAIAQSATVTDDHLPNSFTEATHVRMTSEVSPLEVHDEKSSNPLTSTSPPNYSEDAKTP